MYIIILFLISLPWVILPLIALTLPSENPSYLLFSEITISQSSRQTGICICSLPELIKQTIEADYFGSFCLPQSAFYIFEADHLGSFYLPKSVFPLFVAVFLATFCLPISAFSSNRADFPAIFRLPKSAFTSLEQTFNSILLRYKAARQTADLLFSLTSIIQKPFLPQQCKIKKHQ